MTTEEGSDNGGRGLGLEAANLLGVLEIVEAQFQLGIALPIFLAPIPDSQQTLFLQQV